MEKITLSIFHYVFGRSSRKVNININILYFVKRKQEKIIEFVLIYCMLLRI